MKQPSRLWLLAVAENKVDGYASTEMIQELCFHLLRRTADRRRAARESAEIARTLHLLPFDARVLDRALSLLPDVQVGARDCVHAATALSYGIEAIVTSDKAFDSVPGLRRIDPTVPPSSVEDKR